MGQAGRQAGRQADGRTVCGRSAFGGQCSGGRGGIHIAINCLQSIVGSIFHNRNSVVAKKCALFLFIFLFFYFFIFFTPGGRSGTVRDGQRGIDCIVSSHTPLPGMTQGAPRIVFTHTRTHDEDAGGSGRRGEYE